MACRVNTLRNHRDSGSRCMVGAVSGHTPGPWSFDGPSDNHIVWSDPDNRICFMAHSNGIDPERDTANARLIAAAPELLDALQAIVAMQALRSSDATGTHLSLSVLCETARAAIAKAEGLS